MGAMKVALCFSAASSRIANMSLFVSACFDWCKGGTYKEVRNISRKSP
jgi:hypothetical protein